MVEASLFLLEASLDHRAGLLGELLLGERLIFVVFEDADAIEVDGGMAKRPTLEDAVGVLDREDGDWAFRLIGHREGTRVEGEDAGVRELLVPGSLGSDADGTLVFGDIASRRLDDLGAREDVVLDDA